MLWSGSSPLSVMRDSMWGFLMFAGVAWLAIGWSVLRLEPADIVAVAGPVIFFGALCEAVRALAGTKTWWLNAGMAVLFTATGTIVLLDADSSYTTPASLVGWFLMVRGAVDIAVSTMNRGVDRTWGLMLSLGVAQAGLGFYAAGPLARTADPVIVTLGALALLRSVADLVTSLRLREVSGVRHDVLHLPPERAAGVAGYSAGLEDYEAAPAKARHRAGQLGAATQPATTQLAATQLAAAQPTAAGTAAAGTAAAGTAAAGTGAAGTAAAAETAAAAAAAATAATATAAGHAAEPREPTPTFHDEVVRTTKDLDTMIAHAGVTGTAGAAHRVPDNLPPAPDSAEGLAAQAEHRST